jgi:hypothetical protein
LFSALRAQGYESLVDTAKRWNCLHMTAGGPPPQQKSTSNIRFTYDTIISLKTYKVVEGSTDSLHLAWSAFGFIREDTAGKVYYRAFADTSEKTLYDFNLNIGDSILVPPFPFSYMHVVTVDSVYIYDKFHKRIVFAEFETWIEGVGSLCGILMSGYGLVTGTQQFLLCYFEHDTLKYKNPDYTECYYNTVGIDDWVDLQKINIFPNPFSSSTTIQLSNPLQSATFCIYDILGKEIKYRENLSGKEIIIQKENMKTGMYFFTIEDRSGFVGKGKMVVE